MKETPSSAARKWVKRTLQVALVIGCGILIFYIIKPFQANVSLFEGYKAAVRKEWNQAIPNYERAIKFDPYDGEIRFYLGYAYLKTKNYDQAADHFKKSLETKLDPSAFNNLGNVYLEQGKLKEAEEAYRNALYTQVSRKFSLNNLGCIYQKTGRLKEGEEMFEGALASSQKYAVAEKNLKVVQSLLKRYQYPLKRYGSPLLEDFFTGKTYSEMGQGEKALEYYEKAAALLIERDKDLEEEKKSEEWIEFRKNLGIIAQLYTIFGQALVRAGKYEEAIPLYETTTYFNPRNVQKIYQYIASLYLKIGDEKKANEWMKKAQSFQ